MSSPTNRESQVISRPAAILVLLGGMTVPALGQIVTPSLFPPPCSGNGCMTQNQGAKVIPQGATQALRGCPQGTVLDARKGTCKVLPQAPGTP